MVTCIWVAMCRPSGALFNTRTPSHPFRGGLRSFVPDGTGERINVSVPGYFDNQMESKEEKYVPCSY
jgi:hypothetical protein